MDNRKAKRDLILAAMMLALLGLAAVSVMAQQDRDQMQDRDRIRDPSTQDADEPDWDRMQNRTRLRDPSSHDVTVINMANWTPGQQAGNPFQLRQMMQARQQAMDQQMQDLPPGERQVLQNQNRVRLAVHTFLDMENLTGGIGPQVREIAREFNNSVQATIQAENRIQERNAFARFLVGGDEDAAQILRQQAEQNRQRLQVMSQLEQDCDCDRETRAVLREQIQALEEEQNRLQQLAEEELDRKGMLGWIWK